MTDDPAMGALPPTCKPDDDADADFAGPLVLLAPQAAISVEIDDDGDMILRQECALGGDGDVIVIARRNVSEFLERLIDLTPHGGRFYGLGEVPPEWSAQPVAAADVGGRDKAAAPPTSSRRSGAAERQRRCRARKRATVTGIGPSTLPL